MHKTLKKFFHICKIKYYWLQLLYGRLNPYTKFTWFKKIISEDRLGNSDKNIYY